MNNQQNSTNILTVSEAAEYLRVTPETVYSLIKKQEIGAFKVGRLWRIPHQALIEYQSNGVSNDATA